MQLVPFDSSSALPAYLVDTSSFADINKEVVRAAAFPALSIKGMKFTVSRDGVKTIMTKPDDPEEVAQSIGVVFLRANLNAKTFYAKKYAEGESDGKHPDCYSHDGVTPSANARDPQATKCALCKHNQWGSRVSESGKEGKECQDNARIAISVPDAIDPMLLRVPPKSLKPLKDMLKVVAARKVPYNAVVVKVGFDREAPSPVLTFKPIGLMDDVHYAQVRDAYDGELVRTITGLDDFEYSGPASAAPAVSTDELDAAIAAREVTKKAAAKLEAPKKSVMDDLDEVLSAKPAAKPAPEPEEAPAPKKAKPEPKPEPAVKKSGASDLLADLDDLLGTKDD